MESHPLIRPTIKLPSLPCLSERETAALEAYCAELIHAVSIEHVKSVVLYGSKARGDTHPGSDIDLLVVLDPGDEAQKEAEMKVGSQIILDYGISFESLVYSAQEAGGMQRVGHPLMQNIAREGVVLIGEGIVVNPIEKKRFVQQYMDRARERLVVAEAAINVGGYRDSVSRSYYAFLDAADAALIAVDFIPQSHAGTISKFGERFVKTKLVPGHYNEWFRRIKKAREEADYYRHMTIYKADAERALERAREFVSVIEKLLPSLLPPDS